MSVTDEFVISGIGQIAVQVRDLEAAVRFYRDTLGLGVLLEVPHMAFVDCGGVRLMLTVPQEEGFDHPASVLYYRVPDIRRGYETLRDRGARFEGEPHKVADLGDHELWMAFFRDPSDNLLALMSEVPTAHP